MKAGFEFVPILHFHRLGKFVYLKKVKTKMVFYTHKQMLYGYAKTLRNILHIVDANIGVLI